MAHVGIKYLCKLYSELGTFGPPQCRLFWLWRAANLSLLTHQLIPLQSVWVILWLWVQYAVIAIIVHKVSPSAIWSGYGRCYRWKFITPVPALLYVFCFVVCFFSFVGRTPELADCATIQPLCSSCALKCPYIKKKRKRKKKNNFHEQPCYCNKTSRFGHVPILVGIVLTV